MDLYQKFDHDIFDVTKILIGLSLTDGQKAELSKIAGEIDAAYSSGQLTAHERSRLLGTREISQSVRPEAMTDEKRRERLCQIK